MNQMINLEKLQNDASTLVETAIGAGADACDCIVAHSQSLAVGVREGQVEDTNRSEKDALTLRVFCGNQVANVTANAMDDPVGLATRAVAMAKVSPEDQYQGLAPSELLADKIPDLDLADSSIPDAQGLIDSALACEAAGLEVDGIEKSMGAGAGWAMSGFVLATSDGFEGNYSISRFMASAAMVAGSGTSMERDYEHRAAVHETDLPDLAEIGRIAGERTVRRLGPQQAESGRVPIVFDRRVAGGLLGNMMGAINGAAIARKTSFLRDQMGKQIASANITVRDNPLKPRGLGSSPFDGEGMSGRELVPVENGILKEWILDWASARELGLESNFRASRSGAGISPSTTNCHIEPGSQSPDEMIKSIGTGLYLTETIGHGINMVTGDYSKGASGFWIENGEIAYPVAEITIAGNLKDMFLNMTPADDLEFRGSVNSPTLLVEGMTIGGK
ncbi:MAG: TldD/PmbA family protein [Rhizobiaceae bacterium]